MRAKRSIILFIGLCFAKFAFATTSADHFVGEARDPKSNKLLYKEVHCVLGAKNNAIPKEKVFYLAPDNQLIATKQINGFNDNQSLKPTSGLSVNPIWVPQYRFVHHEFGIGEAVRYDSGKLVLKRKESSQDNWEEKSLSLDTEYDTIADAGFDYYVREHLDELSAGNSLTVTYLSAPRLTSIDFRMKLISQSDDVIALSLEPQNFFIRLLVDPIKLTYEKQGKRLLSFEGLTNVPKSKSENHIALISYRYGENVNEFCS